MAVPSLVELAELVEAGPPELAMLGVAEHASAYATDDGYHALLDRLARQLGAPEKVADVRLDLGWRGVEPMFEQWDGPFGTPNHWWLKRLPELGSVDVSRFDRIGPTDLPESRRELRLTLPPALPSLVMGRPKSRHGYSLSVPRVWFSVGGVLTFDQRHEYFDASKQESTRLVAQVHRVRGWLFHCQAVSAASYYRGQ